MNLFQKVDFISHSGKPLDWKIECDALSNKDWECIAYLISKRFTFGMAIGIAEGGTKLANALNKYQQEWDNGVLIVDDVLTTGNSMEEMRTKYYGNPKGVVLFARGKCPDWITPIFQMCGEL